MAEPTQIKTDPESVSENTESQIQEALGINGEQTQQNPKGVESTEGVNAFGPEPLKTDLFLNALIENNQNKAPAPDTNQAEVDVEALQQLIAEGADPTQLLEETAAGEGEPTDGGGIYIPTIDRTAEEVLADAGFDTTTTVTQDKVVEEVLITEPVVIEPPDNGVVINGIKAEGSDIVVDEDGLQGAVLDTSRLGETDSTENATAQNTFTVVAPDGVDTVTIDGHTVISNGSLVAAPSFTTDLGNTFEIISYVSNTGVITYKYTLESSETHAGDDVEDSISETFEVVLVDTDGDSTTEDGIQSTETITVSIVDDIPSITVDVTTATETALQVDETTLSVNDTKSFANSFTNNTLAAGADGQSSIVTTYTLGITATTDSGLVDTATGENVILSINSGAVEGRTETSDDLVFTVSTDNSGDVTLDQARAMVNPTNPLNHNEPISLVDGLITLTREDTITDGDNDTASDTAAINIGANLTFLDDGPSITVDVTTATETALQVDETTLSVNDTKSFANSFTNNTLAAGADGQSSIVTTYTLGITATTDSGLVDTATGENVILSINSGAVEGRTETSDDLVFTVSTDNSGDVTLDQARAMVNPTNPLNHNEPISLVDGLITLTREDTITDGDNDTASDTAAINIGANLTFLDDGPDNYHPTAGLLENDGSDTITESLNTISKIGADGYGGNTNVKFDVTQAGLSSLTSNEVPIYYYVSVDGKTLTGSTSATEVDVDLSNTILTVVINDTTDEYTVTMIGTVDNGSGVGFANLSGTGEAGNGGFKIVTSSTLNSDLEILFTPLGSATTVNSDSDDVAVGGQFIEDGDGLRIDFGEFSNNTLGTNTGQDDTFVINDKDTINGFCFTIDQIAAGTTATLALSVSDNNDPIDNILTNDTPDSIYKVEIYNHLKVLIATWDGVGNDNANGIAFSSSGGDVTVSGLLANYSIVTFTNDGFDGLEVTNDTTAGTDGKFSLSNLKVLSVDSGSAIDLSFDTTLTDADGDTSTGTVDVTLAPDAVTVLGTSGDDFNLTGTAIDDIIFGGAGDDILVGGAGDDLLNGGLGHDTLTGGADADTFAYSAGDGGNSLALADLIADFTDGSDLIGLDGLAFGTASGEATFVGADTLGLGGSSSDSVLVISDGAGSYTEVLAVIESVMVSNLDVNDTTVI